MVICIYGIAFTDFILSIYIYSATPTNNLIVNPSLEFGLDTHHLQDGEVSNKRRRSSVQEVIVSLGHEIQRVPDLVVSQTIKVRN